MICGRLDQMTGAHKELAQTPNKDHRQKFSTPVVPRAIYGGAAAAVGSGGQPLHCGWRPVLEQEFGTGFELIFEAGFIPTRPRRTSSLLYRGTLSLT